MPEVSPEMALWTYRLAYIGLIIGAAVVLASTLLLFWSDAELKRHDDMRLSANERETAKTKLAIAQANARTKEAELKLEQLRNSMAPRRLSQEERERIIVAVSQFKGQKFETGVYVDDLEARGLWADIFSALKSADWEAAEHISFVGGLIVGVEVSIAPSKTNTGVQFAAQALVKALLSEKIKAHIAIENANQEARPDVILVYVGKKPAVAFAP